MEKNITSVSILLDDNIPDYMDDITKRVDFSSEIIDILQQDYNMPNNYLNFDADDKNGPLKQLVRYYSEIFLSENKLDKNNQTQVIKFAKETINNYSTYSDDTELNKLFDIFSFRPHEFNKINNYNSDLFEFKNWIIKQDFDFRNG